MLGHVHLFRRQQHNVADAVDRFSCRSYIILANDASLVVHQDQLGAGRRESGTGSGSGAGGGGRRAVTFRHHHHAASRGARRRRQL